MNSSFISRKDKIIVAAIEIISESGLAALSTRSLAAKENMSESLIYKYFGGLNEVLVGVVSFFVKFDRSIMDTISAKSTKTTSKIRDFFDAYATYYDNYREITTIIINYEELLHNSGTREMITNCITERTEFLINVIREGIEKKEIKDIFGAEELANILISIMNGAILNRRVMHHEMSFKTEVMQSVNKILRVLEV